MLRLARDVAIARARLSCASCAISRRARVLGLSRAANRIAFLARCTSTTRTDERDRLRPTRTHRPTWTWSVKSARLTAGAEGTPKPLNNQPKVFRSQDSQTEACECPANSVARQRHCVCTKTARGREHGADPPAFEGSAPRGGVLHVGLQTTPPVRPYPMPRLARVCLLIGAIALWAFGCG